MQKLSAGSEKQDPTIYYFSEIHFKYKDKCVVSKRVKESIPCKQHTEATVLI